MSCTKNTLVNHHSVISATGLNSNCCFFQDWLHQHRCPGRRRWRHLQQHHRMMTGCSRWQERQPWVSLISLCIMCIFVLLSGDNVMALKTFPSIATFSFTYPIQGFGDWSLSHGKRWGTLWTTCQSLAGLTQTHTHSLAFSTYRYCRLIA